MTLRRERYTEKDREKSEENLAFFFFFFLAFDENEENVFVDGDIDISATVAMKKNEGRRQTEDCDVAERLVCHISLIGIGF